MDSSGSCADAPGEDTDPGKEFPTEQDSLQETGEPGTGLLDLFGLYAPNYASPTWVPGLRVPDYASRATRPGLRVPEIS